MGGGGGEAEGTCGGGDGGGRGASGGEEGGGRRGGPKDEGGRRRRRLQRPRPRLQRLQRRPVPLLEVDVWLLVPPEVRSLVAESPAGKTEIRRLQPRPRPPPPLRGGETLRPLQVLLGGGGAPPPLPPPRPTEASGAWCTSISRQTLSSHKGVFVLFEHLLSRTLFPCALCLLLFLLHPNCSKLSTAGLFCSPLSCCGFSLLVALWALRGGSFQFAVRRGALSLPPQDSPPHSTALKVFFFLSKDSPTLCSLGVSTAIGRPQKVGRRDLKGGRQARVRKKKGGR